MNQLPKVNKTLRVFKSDRLGQKVVRAIGSGLVVGILIVGANNASASTSQAPTTTALDVSKVLVLNKLPMPGKLFFAEHYSHSSHSSHDSHSSHYSHQSHYSSRY